MRRPRQSRTLEVWLTLVPVPAEDLLWLVLLSVGGGGRSGMHLQLCVHAEDGGRVRSFLIDLKILF